MQTIIYHTTIVTADEQCTVHYDAAMAIAEERIVALGSSAELLARYSAAERIDGRGKAVMPGFANVHTHFGPHLVPLLRVVSCFVHQGPGRDVEAVMVDGRWLMRDGSVYTMDEEAIVREADRIGRAAWRRLFEERQDLQPPARLHRTVYEE
jgi:cytosine/adenosine deaminase-related metal-dependent hydrolase